ncbi:MAG: FtsX-like permease family protein [Pirellulales bacterium]|nr:FtsX-like permease family protein [Pirellulales bacterium]
MYKLLLCWRYLRTRYIALVSIISVMLGVATMIVVNSVMEGFSGEMQNRIHNSTSDIVIDALDFAGMPDAEYQFEQIRKAAGEDIEAMSPVVLTIGMLNLSPGGRSISMPVRVIGIDEATQGLVSDFNKYLQHPENRKKMSFALREDKYDTRDHQADGDAPDRSIMAEAGWKRRRMIAESLAREQKNRWENPAGAEIRRQSYVEGAEGGAAAPRGAAEGDPEGNVPPPVENVPTGDIFQQNPALAAAAAPAFDMAKDQHTGIVLGMLLASRRFLLDSDEPNGGCEDRFYVLPGEDVKLTFPTAGTPPKVASDTFTVVDFFESKMSESDSSFVFVPIRELQRLRGMSASAADAGMINQILIKLKPGVDGDRVRDKLKAIYPETMYSVQTWRDQRSPLLAAVQLETTILNVLLFFIIAVAGFGILAIFYMIVVEKTRDIGILKSLGASRGGVMGIFLAYGLSLGLVGSGAGLVIGLLFVQYINQIADFLSWVRGMPVFDPTIYYFNKIPTSLVPQTVISIVVGAVAIAVLASILPARRAARLHPVEALRYE